jgi:hypothetical protein
MVETEDKIITSYSNKWKNIIPVTFLHFIAIWFESLVSHVIMVIMFDKGRFILFYIRYSAYFTWFN